MDSLLHCPIPFHGHIYKCLALGEVTCISHPLVLLFLMSTANIKYPPAAHPYHDESAQQPVITNVQPRGGTTMAIGSDNGTAQVGKLGKAKRLRGGCVPCPVCFELFVRCIPYVADWFFVRTEVCVGSSHYRAAAVAKRTRAGDLAIRIREACCQPAGSYVIRLLRTTYTMWNETTSLILQVTGLCT
jgi:hypothetical protein